MLASAGIDEFRKERLNKEIKRRSRVVGIFEQRCHHAARGERYSLNKQNEWQTRRYMSQRRWRAC
ncbi:MAG: hypothetical protein IPF57_17370 [Gammaproteobacteria bacterium]|nr:hypothetical protein [Gammaproteobacteria bacterium]